jgi:integrase
MSRLRATAARLLASTRAPATRDAYSRDWAAFGAWCRSAGRLELPAEQETVQLHLVDMLDSGMSVSYAERRIAAIVAAHRAANVEPPIGYGVRDLMRAARRERGGPEGKAALSVSELKRVLRALPKSPMGARDRALLLVGFAGGLRRSELAGLDLADVRFERRGVVVHLGRSKTDQNGHGRDVPIWRGRRVRTCPVRALRLWLSERGREPGPLFVGFEMDGTPGGWRLSGRQIARIVQRSVAAVGLDPARYAGHSLRAGCATAAAEGGAGDLAIMERTGHRSLATLKRYVRHGRLFAVDPLAGVL